jgi:hypothetical protein
LSGLDKTLKSFNNLSQVENILVLSDYRHEDIERIKVSFKHLNLKCFEIESSGIYNAINYGLNNVETQYFMCINGGDRLFDSENLNKLLRNLEGKKWGYGSVSIINPLTNSKRKYNFNHYSVLKHRFSLKYVPHPSVIMDTTFARGLSGFDENFKISADQKLIMQFGINFRPFISKDVISEFYLGGESTRSQSDITSDFKEISEDLFKPIFRSRFIEKFLWDLIRRLRSFMGNYIRKV